MAMKTKGLVLVAVCVLLLPIVAWAQGGSGGKIAVINFSRAIGESTEGKAAIGEFQTKVNTKREELVRKNTEIEELQKQLNTQSKALNDDTRATMAKNIETKTTELTRAQEDAQKEFGQLQNEIFNRIGQKIYPIVQQYAKDNGLIVVLDTSQTNALVYADPATDITDEVIKKFDAAPSPAAAKSPAAPAPAVSTAPAQNKPVPGAVK
jgi:outer membrane protein